MTYSPVYQDILTHSQYGKSRLPIFIMEKYMQYNYPLHHHNFAELSVVLAGTGTEILNGEAHRFKRGTVSFLLPHHIHEIRLDQPNVHKYNCMFDVQLLFSSPSDRELANTLLQTGKEIPSHYDLEEEQTVILEQMFISMKKEYESEQFGKDTVLRSILLEAFVYLVRTRRPAAAKASLSLRSKDHALELLHFLHLHFQEEITLTQLADEFNLNASYISRIFKQHVGKTLTEYLHSLRVGMATSLLVTTTMSIVDITFEVGFEHARTFARVFKELHGITPTQYRETHLQHR